MVSCLRPPTDETMSSLRTPTDVSQFLRDDLAWRRKELRVYEDLVRTAETKARQACLRGAVAVLYAHWEGHVKTALQQYVSYVRMLRHSHSQLADSFVAMSAKQHLSSLAGSEKPSEPEKKSGLSRLGAGEHSISVPCLGLLRPDCRTVFSLLLLSPAWPATPFPNHNPNATAASGRDFTDRHRPPRPAPARASGCAPAHTTAPPPALSRCRAPSLASTRAAAPAH